MIPAAGTCLLLLLASLLASTSMKMLLMDELFVLALELMSYLSQ